MQALSKQAFRLVEGKIEIVAAVVNRYFYYLAIQGSQKTAREGKREATKANLQALIQRKDNAECPADSAPQRSASIRLK